MSNRNFTKEELDFILSVLEINKQDPSLFCCDCDVIERFISVFEGFYSQYIEYVNSGVEKDRIFCEIQPHFMVKLIRDKT